MRQPSFLDTIPIAETSRNPHQRNRKNNLLYYSNGIGSKSNLRFDRQNLFFSNFTDKLNEVETFNKKISNSRLVIMGLGGMGSTIAKSVVACGVKNLLLIDFDKIQLHNLNRTLLFNDSDVGESKVRIAKKRLLEFYPKANITIIEKRFEKSKREIKEFKPTLIVNCADRPTINYTTNKIIEITKLANCPIFVAGGYFCNYAFTGPLTRKLPLGVTLFSI